MQAALLAEIPLDDFLTLLALPNGDYGISYDISTRDTERNLPYGWNAQRAQTYRHLAVFLERGRFARLQKSDWVRTETSTVETYYSMIMLRNIPPPGKLQSTVQGLKMHRIDDWVYDISEGVRIGGALATHLAGPTPRGLVPDNVPCVQPPANFPLPPRHTSDSNAARDRRNWRITTSMLKSRAECQVRCSTKSRAEEAVALPVA
ncbi:hypothetical protein V8E55_004956 [Tylopilus felleus]